MPDATDCRGDNVANVGENLEGFKHHSDMPPVSCYILTSTAEGTLYSLRCVNITVTKHTDATVTSTM